MASRCIEDLHHDLQPLCREFVRRCQAEGVDPLITCTWRSGAEQDQLYAQGRNGKPGLRVTNARAGQSAHNATIKDQPAARAFDVVPMVGGKPMWDASHSHWQIMGRIGESLGLTWYGNPRAKFREFPHFELHKGYQ